MIEKMTHLWSKINPLARRRRRLENLEEDRLREARLKKQLEEYQEWRQNLPDGNPWKKNMI